MSQRQIRINEEYLDLVPRPSNKERDCLKQSIITDGQQLPIVVNTSGIILDGHTRFEICQELRLKPEYTVKKFKTKEDERKFVISTNIARRHLSTFQKVELAWEIYENEKKRAKIRADWMKYVPEDLHIRDPVTGKIKIKKQKIPEQFQKQGNAALIFARYIGLGHTTVHKVEWLKKNAKPEVLQQLRDGEISIDMTYSRERGISFIGLPRGKRELPKICPLCKSDTVLIKDKPCHVHRLGCCTVCKWGT